MINSKNAVILWKQKNINLYFLALLSVLLSGVSSSSFAMDHYSYVTVKNPLAKYGKLAFVGSRLIPPLYNNLNFPAACGGDKAMGDYQGGETQFSPLGEPGVHTPGEVKKLISARNKMVAKGSISDLVQELYGARIIPGLNQNQDIIVGVSLVDGSQDADNNSTALNEAPVFDEDVDDSSPMTNGLSELFLNSNSTGATQSLHGSTTEANSITTNSVADNVGENAEEPTDANEAAGPEVDFLNFLPDELGLLVLDHLSLEERGNSALVSREWHRIANDNTFWKIRVKRDFHEANIIHVLKNYPTQGDGATLDWKKIYMDCYLIRYYPLGEARGESLYGPSHSEYGAQIGGVICSNSESLLRVAREDFSRVQRDFNLIFENNLLHEDIIADYLYVTGVVGDAEEAQRVFELARESNILSSEIIGNYMLVIEVYGNNSSFDFNELFEKAFVLARDHRMDNDFVNGCFTGSTDWCFKKVYELFERMREENRLNSFLVINYMSVIIGESLDMVIGAFGVAEQQNLIDSVMIGVYISLLEEEFLFGEGDFAEVRRAFDLATNPRRPELLDAALVRQYISTTTKVGDNFQEAQRAFDLAANSGRLELLNPAVVAQYISAARVAGNFAEVQRAFNLATNPGRPELLTAAVINNYISVVRVAGNFGEAQRAFDLATDLYRPELFDFRTIGGYISAARVAGNFAEAKRAFDLAADPGRPELLDLFAIHGYISAAMEDGNFAQAQRAFDLAANSGRPELLDATVIAFYILEASEVGNFAQAQRAFDLAVDSGRPVLLNAAVIPNYISAASDAVNFGEAQRAFDLAANSDRPELLDDSVVVNYILAAREADNFTEEQRALDLVEKNERLDSAMILRDLAKEEKSKQLHEGSRESHKKE